MSILYAIEYLQAVISQTVICLPLLVRQPLLTGKGHLIKLCKYKSKKKEETMLHILAST